MPSMTFNELKQIVESVGELDGWDFSRMQTKRAPVPWDYVDVARQYLNPTDRVLDIGTGGGEIFLSLAPYLGEGIGIDQNPKMIKTAQRNRSAQSIDNITFMQMEGAALQFDADEFDVVLLRHLKVYPNEIVRVLSKVQQVLKKKQAANYANLHELQQTFFV